MCWFLPVPTDTIQILFHNASDLVRRRGKVFACSCILLSWVTKCVHVLGFGRSGVQNPRHLHWGVRLCPRGRDWTQNRACSRIPLLWEIGRGGGAKSYSVPGASSRWEPKTEIVNSHTALCPGACTKSRNVPEFCTHGETPCTKIPAWPGILYTQKVAVYKIPAPFF